jgi:chaperonin cofactor prefoldin
MLRKTLEEKDNIVKQLKDIIEVLELKLKNSEEMEGILQNKVNQLTEALNKNEIVEEK